MILSDTEDTPFSRNLSLNVSQIFYVWWNLVIFSNMIYVSVWRITHIGKLRLI